MSVSERISSKRKEALKERFIKAGAYERKKPLSWDDAYYSRTVGKRVELKKKS